MTSIITRRTLLRGLFAAPAVVAASSLMPVWKPLVWRKPRIIQVTDPILTVADIRAMVKVMREASIPQYGPFYYFVPGRGFIHADD